MIHKSKLPGRINQLVCNLSSKTDLSPRGLISLLMFLYDLMSFSVIDDFANEAFLQGLISLLEEEQVSNLEEWPTSLGGGEVFLV